MSDELMKLWILRPIDTNDDRLWGFDSAFGFVVRAASSDQARKLASEQAGCEGAYPWQNPTQTTCQVINHVGPAEVILRDQRTG